MQHARIQQAARLVAWVWCRRVLGGGSEEQRVALVQHLRRTWAKEMLRARPGWRGNDSSYRRHWLRLRMAWRG